MSLIVGIKCSDGIVVGADSAATFGTLGKSTIRQSAKKIQIIDRKLICGVAGPAGLAQQYLGELEDIWADTRVHSLPGHKLMASISQQFISRAAPLMEAAGKAKATYGSVAWENAMGSAIVAMPTQGSPSLFWFDPMCAPEEVTEQLPFVSIGIGQPIADPFLALLKRVVWQDQLPNLRMGTFSLVWTLKHTIQTNPGGIAEPIQVVTLAAGGSDLAARELEQNALKEMEEAVISAELEFSKATREFMGLGVEVETPPSPPEPPSQA